MGRRSTSGGRRRGGERRLIVAPRVAADVVVGVEDQDARRRPAAAHVNRRREPRDPAAHDDHVIASAIVFDRERARCRVASAPDRHRIRREGEPPVAQPVRDAERRRQVAAAQRAWILAERAVAGVRGESGERAQRHRPGDSETARGDQRPVQEIPACDGRVAIAVGHEVAIDASWSAAGACRRAHVRGTAPRPPAAPRACRLRRCAPAA